MRQSIKGQASTSSGRRYRGPVGSSSTRAKTVQLCREAPREGLRIALVTTRSPVNTVIAECALVVHDSQLLT
jgi:hypothetical protein